MDQKDRGCINYFKAAAVEFIRHDVKGLTEEEKGDEGNDTEIEIFYGANFRIDRTKKIDVLEAVSLHISNY